MSTLVLTLIVAAWVICAWLTMAMFRERCLRVHGEWTVADRRFAALYAALGPVGFGGTLLGFALVALADSDDRVLERRERDR